MNYYNSETLLEQQQEIEKLKEQNAALAAQVEALKDWRRLALQFDGHRMQAMSTLKMVATGNFDMEEVRRFIASAPVSGEQHLVEIRAQAGRDGFFKGVAWILDIDVKDISAMAAEEAANQYADSIQKGAK